MDDIMYQSFRKSKTNNEQFGQFSNNLNISNLSLRDEQQDMRFSMLKEDKDYDAQRESSESSILHHRRADRILAGGDYLTSSYESLLQPSILRDSAQSSNQNGNCVQVVVRIRPTSKPSIAEHSVNKIFEIGEDLKTITIGKELNKQLGSTRFPSYQFSFDRIFDEGTSQHYMYQKCITPLFNAFTKGINCTVFTFGQTRSGKTYCLEGSSEMDRKGMIPRFTEELFEYIQSFSSSSSFASKFTLKASYVQIYNESVSDLLAVGGNHNMKIMEDGEKGTYIVGLTYASIKTASDIYNVLKVGKSNRGVPNNQSKPPDLHARSHTILTLHLEQTKPTVRSQSPAVRNTSISSLEASKSTMANKVIRSKFAFVEFAGSEKSRETTISTSVQSQPVPKNDESSKIAKTFNALMTVVSFLSRPGHIPYRDSKLTHILKDNLTDQSLALFVTSLYPLYENFNETLAAAKYAFRLKQTASLLQNSTNDRRSTSPSTLEKRKVAFTTIDEQDEVEQAQKQELKKLKEAHQKLSVENSMLESYFKETKKETDTIAKEKEELKSQLISQISEIEKLKEDLQTSKRELKDSSNNLRKVQTEKEYLQRELLSKESLNSREKEAIDITKNELIFTKNELVAAREDRDSLRKQNEEFKFVLEKEVERRKSAEISAEHWKNEFYRIDEERKSLRQEMLESSRKFASIHDANNDLRTSLNIARADIDQLLQIKEKLEQNLATVSENLAQVTRQNDILNRKLLNSSHRELGIDEETVSLRSEIASLEAELAKAKDEKKMNLKEYVKMESKRIAELESEVARLKQELVITRKESKRALNQSMSRETSFSFVEQEPVNEVSNLKSKLSIVADENDTLKDNLNQSLREISKLSEQKDKLTQEILSRHSVDTSSKVQQILSDNMRMSQELSSKRKQLQERYEENQHLRMEIADLKLALQQLKSKCERYQNEIDELQQSVQQESSISELSRLHEKEDMLNQIHELREEIDTLTKQLADTKRGSEEKLVAEKQLEMATKELKSIKSEKERLQSLVAKCEQQLEDIETSSKEQISSKEIEVQKLSQEREKMKAELFAKDKELLETKEAVLRLRGAVVKNVAFEPKKPRASPKMDKIASPIRLQDISAITSPSKSPSRSLNSSRRISDDIAVELDLISNNVGHIQFTTKTMLQRVEELSNALKREQLEKAELISKLNEQEKSLNNALEEKKKLLSFKDELLKEKEEKEAAKRDTLQKEMNIKQLTLQIESLTFEVRQKAEEVDAITKGRDKLRSDLMDANNKVRSLLDKCSEMEYEVTQLRRDLEKALKDREDMRDSMAQKLNKEIQKVGEENDSLNKKLEVSEETLRILEKKISEKDQKLQESMAHLHKLKKELQIFKEKTREAGALEEENKSLKLQNAELKVELHKEKETKDATVIHVKRVETERLEFQRRVDELTALLTDSSKGIAALENQLHQARNEVETRSNEVRMLREKATKAEAEVRECTMEKETYFKQLKMKEEVIADIEMVKSKSQQADLQNKQLEHEISNLRAQSDYQIKSLQQEKEKLLNEIDKMQDETIHHKSELSKLKHERMELSVINSKLSEDVQKLRKEREELRQSLIQTKEASNKYLHEKDEIRAKLLKLESSISYHQSEREKLEQQLKRKDMELRDNGEQRQAVRMLEIEIARLKESLKQLEDDLLFKDAELQAVEDEKQRILERLTMTESELERVKNASQKTNQDLKNIISSFGLQ